METYYEASRVKEVAHAPLTRVLYEIVQDERNLEAAGGELS